MRHAEQVWPGVAANVAEARGFVRRTLASWGTEDLEWAASAVVSELATNAILHAGTPFAVALTLAGDQLRLEVRDGSPARPVVRHYDEHATTGRGLRLVLQLSDEWGVEPGQSSKTVWCVLPFSRAAQGTLDEDVNTDEDVDVDVDALLTQFEELDASPAAEAAPSRQATGRQAA